MIVQTFVAALVVLPIFTQSALAATCARTYTVKPGDICDSISAAQHVSTYQLAITNSGIINSGCSNLMPGQTICLGNVGQDCTTTHVVAIGDTCDAISQAAGITNTILYGNNPQINQGCTNIYVGEVLCISNQIQVPSAPAGAPVPATAIPTTAVAPVPVPSQAPAVPVPSPSPSGDDLPWCDEL